MSYDMFQKRIICLYCKHIIPNIAVDDYIYWIDKPCPICEFPLVTMEDYYRTMWIQSLKDMNCALLKNE